MERLKSMNQENSERSLNLISEGLSPAQIAKQIGVPTQEVVQFLVDAVNEGRLRRSDVFFTLAPELRQALEICGDAVKKRPTEIIALGKSLWNVEIDPEEAKLYFAYRAERVRLGDMYELLADLERTLHSLIKSTLIKTYGGKETGWWRQGVPEGVRVDCAAARECDPEFYEDSYGYTTVLNLSKIFDVQWRLFESRLPLSVAKQKKVLLENLKRLNSIRNRVMHPVRGGLPTEDDFDFVKSMRDELDISRWRLT